MAIRLGTKYGAWKASWARSLILVDEWGCRNPLGADKKFGQFGVEPGISRAGQGAGAWCRTCCYWFCGSMVLECTGWFNRESGFWAIIERKIQYG
jgi:hypothetical protein